MPKSQTSASEDAAESDRDDEYNEASSGSGSGSDASSGSEESEVEERRRDKPKPVKRPRETEGSPESVSKRSKAAEEPRDKDGGLFEDKAQVGAAEKQLDRAIQRVKPAMLEAVRLPLSRVLDMMEHPRADQFFIGSYVRYPNVEGGTACLPSQVIRASVEDPPRVYRSSDGIREITWNLTMVQYTMSPEKQLLIRKRPCQIEMITEEGFTDEEVEIWKGLLRMFIGRPGVEKLYQLPESLQVKAAHVKTFTYTEEDVEVILRRKADASSHEIPLNRSELYIKRVEVEAEIKELKATTEGETSSKEARAKLSRLEATLKEIQKRLAATLSTAHHPRIGSTPTKGADLMKSPTKSQFGANYLRPNSTNFCNSRAASSVNKASAVLPPLAALVKPAHRWGFSGSLDATPGLRPTSSDAIWKLSAEQWKTLRKTLPEKIASRSFQYPLDFLRAQPSWRQDYSIAVDVGAANHLRDDCDKVVSMGDYISIHKKLEAENE